MEYFIIIVNAILVKNIVFAQFLGVCPFLGVSRKIESAIGMSMAVLFVLGLASVMSWLAQVFILEALHIEYLQTITFILIIATLVQFVEMVVRKFSPSLYKSLGVYLPLITTNCAVLGVAILNINHDFNLPQSITNGVANALGFTLALVLFAGIRERLDYANVPKAFKGVPISLVVAGILSISFLGFSGLL
ncbi:electron transport complex protein RnfA [Desulfonispora thiosulfatigenes DSM 11270]|uniref:Ion-translocating oxidoreductase complex subunit A n=1 Tax=Desulfonispora thiosulfatigenes DSM 11270 TaxID=656914 RepID=A0A1W1UIU9_DESTI|nr:electron transport complex subunit RsxA [Desulfonispora thiosulfatigenes]SMB81000.1 electron transport complex protein RnfA [Desulfonispora thiosulfatigenes DSM 11270]